MGHARGTWGLGGFSRHLGPKLHLKPLLWEETFRGSNYDTMATAAGYAQEYMHRKTCTLSWFWIFSIFCHPVWLSLCFLMLCCKVGVSCLALLPLFPHCIYNPIAFYPVLGQVVWDVTRLFSSWFCSLPAFFLIKVPLLPAPGLPLVSCIWFLLHQSPGTH